MYKYSNLIKKGNVFIFFLKLHLYKTFQLFFSMTFIKDLNGINSYIKKNII